MSAVRDELLKLAATAPADDETARARDFATGTFRLGLESTMALAQRAGESLLMTGEVEAIDEVVEATAAVQPADVQRLAQQLFRPGAFSAALVGPGGDPDRLRAILDAA